MEVHLSVFTAETLLRDSVVRGEAGRPSRPGFTRARARPSWRCEAAALSLRKGRFRAGTGTEAVGVPWGAGVEPGEEGEGAAAQPARQGHPLGHPSGVTSRWPCSRKGAPTAVKGGVWAPVPGHPSVAGAGAAGGSGVAR